ncbi:GNAT family N-acetyltransferase [Planococcus shixiaomingii]|uniref:GNAT family N-acetyltransferase n=1 Tax=Planococcus shixiaomingii TaxID=3058393 RepID=UPI00262A1B3E|nr:GNAT family N-acetyltransferase [Planococcus sp. N022]WKA53099.1 GNAT family N-acetyltransferase [Planococcus sp. N022]
MKFRKVSAQDIIKTDHLFYHCLTDLLTREKITEEGLLEHEVDRLQKAVQESLANQDKPFFIAEQDEEIIGTIALYPPGPMITSALPTVTGSYEVACVYVHPEYQRQGVGKFLFQNIIQELRLRGHTAFFLDAGFSSSQKYWEDVLGEPSCVVENYWGLGKHHLVWKRELQ